MIKKILKVIAKTLIAIFLFYTIAGFVIIPLAVKFIVPWQATKILKTPVKLKSVFLNPFSLKISVNDFEIQNSKQRPIISFENFSSNISFTQLFKKKINVESVSLDGLFVDAMLLPDGKVNLLDLVPEAKEKKETTAEDKEAKEPMPVIIDVVSIKDGSVRFTDKTVTPNFSTRVDNIDIEVTGFTTNPEDTTSVTFTADLDNKGKIAVEAITQPLAQPLKLDTTFHLNNYAMKVLSPYVGKYTGKELEGGKLDFSTHYNISDNELTASHKLLIQNFDFGNKIDSPDALKLPFGLAIGLLEDQSGKIDISLPVKGDMNDPEFEYFHLIGQVARNFFIKLVTKPFSILASVVGGGESGTEELGSVNFASGKTDLSEKEKEKLRILIKGLKERPRLKLEINGTYDPETDWKAIQADILESDYNKLRKESTRSESSVYQMLYQRRFGIRDLWGLTKQYNSEEDEAKLIQEMKRRLIEEAPPDKEALSALADARAQTIYDFFKASGFDEKRLNAGAVKEAQNTMGFIPAEFTLTVFDEE